MTDLAFIIFKEQENLFEFYYQSSSLLLRKFFRKNFFFNPHENFFFLFFQRKTKFVFSPAFIFHQKNLFKKIIENFYFNSNKKKTSHQQSFDIGKSSKRQILKHQKVKQNLKNLTSKESNQSKSTWSPDKISEFE